MTIIVTLREMQRGIYIQEHVIICNFDLKPGYSGVDNPLYEKKDGVSLLLGDAKDSIVKILNKIKE